ncbi:MAG: hypothetical protein IJX21_08765 [Alistipes sp.]|nr:hypothetical protein [Alistipes sp.]
MANGGDVKILDKLYINQNLICLIVSFLFLERSRHWCCSNYECVFLAMKIFFMLSLVSVVFSLVFYTKEYCKRKTYKAKCHKMRYNYIQEQVSKDNLGSAQGEKIIGW